MRYRPFTASGRAISAITLVLDGALVGGTDPLELIYAALELGANGFELATREPTVVEALRSSLAAAGRQLAVVMLRLDPAAAPGGVLTAAGVRQSIESAVADLGADYLDAVIVERPGAGGLPPDTLAALARARGAGQVGLVGLAGADAVADGYIDSGAFNLLATPFSLQAGWVERNRIKAAVARNLTIVGYDYAPFLAGSSRAPTRPKGLARLFRRREPALTGAYHFLNGVQGWTAEELCLAFALTEPALSTIRVRAQTVPALEALAACVERELPTGVSAQIEMARFSAADRCAPA